MKRAWGWLGAIVVGAATATGSAAVQNGTLAGVVYVRNASSEGAVVYLEIPPARNFTPPRKPTLMDQRNLEFSPSVLPLTLGSAVAFRNSDPLLHNIFSPEPRADAFDLGTYPQGETRIRPFQALGAHLILCHIHPEMEAYVVVVPTTYHAVADARGRFRLTGVPPGTYPLHVWHRRAVSLVTTVTIAPRETVWLEIQLDRRGAGHRGP